MADDINLMDGISTGERGREQSTIGFPYLDLDTAVEVAQAVYNRSGLGACDLDELAAQMGQTMSGAFRMKTGTARIFNLVEKDGKSSIKLSENGRSIVSPQHNKAARVQSFLSVPLYFAIYEKYKGHLLPPPKALEREMQSLGVSSKQTDKARQAFERSARQAAFFESGDDRLVRPRVEQGSAADEHEEEAPSSLPADHNSDVRNPPSVTGKNHPLIQGLLLTLPPPGEKWPTDGRAAWLRMAASIFDMIYTGSSMPITIGMPGHEKAATGT